MVRSTGDLFAFIETHHAQHGVTALCRRLQVTRAGFYAWRRRGESAHARQDRALTTAITRLFARHRERYGSPRIHQLLRQAGYVTSRRRVARLMRAAGLRAKAVRGYRAKANINQRYARHPNRLWTARVTRPNQVWVGDITYLRVAGTWRYLAIVMDQYSRRILAWTLTRHRSAAVTCAVLARAARARPARGVIFHSDRGSEYMGTPFGAQLVRLGLLQSASVRGPGDNAHAEAFFHSLKAELTRGVTFRTERALRRQLDGYIRYYNTIRLHSSLHYRSPLAFERGAA
ncbi:MAG TPA: IS3 family transposase [Gemmatimonadaceae bacterium]